MLRHCQMNGVKDGAHGLILTEKNAPGSKPRVYGDSRILHGLPIDDRKFLIRAYPSAHSATYRRLTIDAANAWDALTAMCRSIGITDDQYLGPYIVEEIMPNGEIKTRIAKGADIFGDGATSGSSTLEQRPSPRPSATVHLHPATSPNYRSPVRRSNIGVAVERRAEVITNVVNILSSETKVKKKTYTIKKDA